MSPIDRLRFAIPFALTAACGVAFGYFLAQFSRASYDAALLEAAHDDRALAVISDLQSSKMILEALDTGDTATVKTLAAEEILSNITYVKINRKMEQSRFGQNLKDAISEAEPIARKFHEVKPSQ